MRNPNRIMSVCSMVERVWREDFSDLRFMQLMSDFTLWYGDDPFYMEDDVFITKFLDFAADMKRRYERREKLMKTYYVDFDGWLEIKANSEEEAEVKFSHLYSRWEKICETAEVKNTFNSMNIEPAENNQKIFLKNT